MQKLEEAFRSGQRIPRHFSYDSDVRDLYKKRISTISLTPAFQTKERTTFKYECEYSYLSMRDLSSIIGLPQENNSEGVETVEGSEVSEGNFVVLED